MFIKSSMVDELAEGLKTQFIKQAQADQIERQDYNQLALQDTLEAADLLDQVGFTSEASVLTSLFEKHAWEVPSEHQPSSEEMVRNLLDHGTVFPMSGSKASPGKEVKAPKESKPNDTNDSTAIEVTDEDSKEDSNEAADGEILEVEDPEKKDWRHKGESEPSDSDKEDEKE